MRRRFLTLLSLLFVPLTGTTVAAQQPTLNEIMDRVRQSEATLITNMSNFKPMV